MMFSERMIARARLLLKKYGRTVTLKRTISGAYDPSTGGTAADTVTTYSGFGLTQFITRTSANQFYGTSTLQQSLIQKDDEMCYLVLDNPTIFPKHPTDILIVGTTEYIVMFSTPLVSGADNVMYILQIRK
jgi:hypothetical protein